MNFLEKLKAWWSGNQRTTKPENAKKPASTATSVRGALAGALSGAWASDHREETFRNKHFTYVVVHAIAQQVQRAAITVYNDGQDRIRKTSVRKSIRSKTGSYVRWRSSRKSVLNDDHGEPLPDNHQLVKLLTQPNPYETNAQFRYRQVQQLRLTGTCLVWNVPSVAGPPCQRYVIPTAAATPYGPTEQFPLGSYKIQPTCSRYVQYDDDGYVRGSPVLRFLLGATVDARQIQKIQYPHAFYLDDGQSPLSACDEWIDLETAVNISRSAATKNGLDPSILYTLSEEEAPDQDTMDRIAANLQAKYGGPHNSGRVIVAHSGATAEALSTTPKEMCYSEGFQDVKNSILAQHQTPPVAVGFQEPGAYAAYNASMKAWRHSAIQPLCDMLAESDTMHLAAHFGENLTVDIESADVHDEDLKLKEDAILLQSQAIRVNEFRSRFDLPPIDGPEGDKFVGAQSAESGSPQQNPMAQRGGELTAKPPLPPELEKTKDPVDPSVPESPFTRQTKALKAAMDGMVDGDIEWLATKLKRYWPDSPEDKMSPLSNLSTEPTQNEKPRQKLGCVMLPMPSMVRTKAQMFARSIDIDEIVEVETDSHVTALYGLLTPFSKDVEEVVRNFGPIYVEFGETKVFPADESRESDVLYVEVASARLVELHDRLANELDCVITHPHYRPHMTIAYLKPGRGAKYAGRPEFIPFQPFAIDWVEFSNSYGDRTPLSLKQAFVNRIKSANVVRCPACGSDETWHQDEKEWTCEPCGCVFQFNGYLHRNGNGKSAVGMSSINGADGGFSLNGHSTSTKTDWDENKHPRGHEGNAGQFSSGSGSSSSGNGQRDLAAEFADKVGEVSRATGKNPDEIKRQLNESNPSNHADRIGKLQKMMDDHRASTEQPTSDQMHEFTSKLIEAGEKTGKDSAEILREMVQNADKTFDGRMEFLQGLIDQHAEANKPSPPEIPKQESGEKKLSPSSFQITSKSAKELDESPDHQAIRDYVKWFCGTDCKPSQLLALTGAGTDDHVDLQEGVGNSLIMNVAAKDGSYQMSRTIWKKMNGDIYMENNRFVTRNNGNGVGAKLFTDQVERCRAAGIERIETNAARDDSTTVVGYKVWPKFGYDGPIGKAAKEGLPEEFRHADTIQDLYRMEGGAAAWEKFGNSIDLTFDLRDGSSSMKRLTEYRDAKAARTKTASMQSNLIATMTDNPCSPEDNEILNDLVLASVIDLSSKTKHAKRDVSGEARDESGKWTAGGGSSGGMPEKPKKEPKQKPADNSGSSADKPKEKPQKNPKPASADKPVGNDKKPVAPQIEKPTGKVASPKKGMAIAQKDANGNFTLEDGSPLPAHINKAIPKAWTHVQVATDPKASLLVLGRDTKGRIQSMYSDAHHETQAIKKFEKTRKLIDKYDKLGKIHETNAKSADAKIAEPAKVMMAIHGLGLRPGSDRDTGADKQAYGATTLRGEHVVVGDNMEVRLRFVGKKGVNIDIPVNVPEVAKMLVEQKKKVGDGRLFNVSDGELRDYAQKNGGFRPKDYRTAKGTKTAKDAIAKMPKPTSEKARIKAIKDIGKLVSQTLGNTPTVALQSYIDPAVFGIWALL